MTKRKAYPGAMGDRSRPRWRESTGNEQSPGEGRLGCALAPPEEPGVWSSLGGCEGCMSTLLCSISKAVSS